MTPPRFPPCWTASCPRTGAEEVRRAIAEDPALARTYDQLAAMDADLTACAAAAVFRPQVSIPAVPGLSQAGIAAVAILMVLVRVAGKLLATGPAIAVQAVVLAVVVGGVLARLIRVAQAELWQPFGEASPIEIA